MGNGGVKDIVWSTSWTVPGYVDYTIHHKTVFSTAKTMAVEKCVVLFSFSTKFISCAFEKDEELKRITDIVENLALSAEHTCTMCRCLLWWEQVDCWSATAPVFGMTSLISRRDHRLKSKSLLFGIGVTNGRYIDMLPAYRRSSALRDHRCNEESSFASPLGEFPLSEFDLC